MSAPRNMRLLLLFHHLLALGVVLAIVITLVLGRGSALFASHQTLGLVLAVMVGVRLLMGIVAAVRIRRGPPRYGDHRAPLRTLLPRSISGWISFSMLPLIIALAVTGLLMQRGMYTLMGLHGILAWGLVVAAVAHVAGLVSRVMRRQEAAPPPLAEAGSAPS